MSLIQNIAKNFLRNMTKKVNVNTFQKQPVTSIVNQGKKFVDFGKSGLVNPKGMQNELCYNEIAEKLVNRIKY